MNQHRDLKTFDITFVMPGGPASDADIGKSLHFHRFMRHARECHKNLLEFLIQNNLLHDVGGSSLAADERKTLLECSAAVAERVKALPFVETVRESSEALPQRQVGQRRTPSAGRGNL